MLFGTCSCFCCAKPQDFTFSANFSYKDEQTYPSASKKLTEVTGLIYILRKPDTSNGNPRVRFEKLDPYIKSDLLHGQGRGQIFPLGEPTPVLDSINLSKQGFTQCHVDKFGVCAELQSVSLDDMGVIGPWAFDKHIGCYCCNCFNSKKEVIPSGEPTEQYYCPVGGNFPTDSCGSGVGGGVYTTLYSSEKAKYRLYWIKVPKKKPTDKQYYILAIPIAIKSSDCKWPTGLLGGSIKITFWNKKDYMDFDDELDGKLPPRPCPYYDEKPAGTGDGEDYNKQLEKLDISIDVPVGKLGRDRLKILWAYDAKDTRLKGNGWYEKRQFYNVVDNTCPTGADIGKRCAPCPCNPYDLPPQQKDPDTAQYHERKYFDRKYNLPLWWQQPSGKAWPMDTGLFMDDCNPAAPTLMEVDDCCCCCQECEKRIIKRFNLVNDGNNKISLEDIRCGNYGDCTKWQIVATRSNPPANGYPMLVSTGPIRCSGADTGETKCLVGLPSEYFGHLTYKNYWAEYEVWIMCSHDCITCKPISFNTTDECPPG